VQSKRPKKDIGGKSAELYEYDTLAAKIITEMISKFPDRVKGRLEHVFLRPIFKLAPEQSRLPPKGHLFNTCLPVSEWPQLGLFQAKK